MVEKQQFLRRTGRAGTGLLITGIAAAGVLLLNTLPVPALQNQPEPLLVDTEGNATHTIACAGAFHELGTNVDDPSATNLVGTPSIVSVEATKKELRATSGDAAQHATAFTNPASAPLAAASTLALSSDTLTGLTAHACVQPETVQWLVGGKTTLGANSAITLSNPGDKNATVNISAFTADGPANSTSLTGVLVPAGESRTLSVNGIAPAAADIALKIFSTGSAVSATLSVGESQNITPQGADMISAQRAGGTELVLLGARSDHGDAAASDAGGAEKLLVRVHSTDGAGAATIYAVTADGKQTELANTQLKKDAVSHVELAKIPENMTALRIVSDKTIVAAAEGDTLVSGKKDTVWFTPAVSFTGTAAAAVVKDGALYLANLGTESAAVKIAAAKDPAKTTTVTLPAGAVQTVKAPANTVLITSDSPVAAGVTVFTSQGAAAYPVAPPREQQDRLAVYVN